MDKQREEFEKYMKNEHPFISTKSEAYEAMYLLWQAAQKVAVPEGFVLVKRNLTNIAAHAAKAVDGRLSAFKYSDVWDAMIEAQEQNDE